MYQSVSFQVNFKTKCKLLRLFTLRCESLRMFMEKTKTTFPFLYYSTTCTRYTTVCINNLPLYLHVAKITEFLVSFSFFWLRFEPQPNKLVSSVLVFITSSIPKHKQSYTQLNHKTILSLVCFQYKHGSQLL